MSSERLIDLLDAVDVVAMSPGAADTAVSGLTEHSAQVEAGWLFCCRRGETGDGHLHAADAGHAGAAALLVERPLRLPLPQVVVRDMSRARPAVAAAFWNHPSQALRLVGVTGTNGKTTITFLLRTILEHHGWSTGVIGTLSGPLTTPGPFELQAELAAMLAAGRQAVAMEVSSHGLDQRRVDATRFAVGVFTNLDRDHLDYHGDMDTYFRAKARLFEPDRIDLGVINRDDPRGAGLLRSPTFRSIGYSLAEVSCLGYDADGSCFGWRGRRVRLRLPGRFNISNALAAATTAEALGVPPSTIAEALSVAVAPPGRMERIEAGQQFRVVVDCAHTPGALSQVMDVLANTGSGRLIVVFGCAGDRDRTKRPEMGRVVADRADVGILTTDNPRSEPVDRIFEDVLRDVGTALVLEPDRGQAIALALSAAGAGDTVLIAGKGNQKVQLVGSSATPFDDRIVARQEILAMLQVPNTKET